MENNVILPTNSAILIFDRNEQRFELENAIQANAMHCILHEMDNWLRSKLKYGHEFKTVDEALEACLTELRNQLQDDGIVI